MISRSFQRPDRTVSRASDARNRYKIRYTRTQHRPASRQVNYHGRVSGTHRLAGETVEVAVDAGLVTISHRGVVVATHAQRHRPDKQAKALRRKPRASRSARPRQPTVGQVVTRKVDSAGCVTCF